MKEGTSRERPLMLVADDYIRKPFSPQELRERVEMLLAHGRPPSTG